MPCGPPEFIPPFIPVTRLKCSYVKIFSPLTEILLEKQSQPALSYEHTENGIRDIEVRRNLGN